MRRSKLEIYIDILEALALYGPLKLTRITYKANINCGLLQQILKEFMENNLVEERKLKNIVVYAVAPKARLIISQFKEVSENLPMIEELIME
jgi:predicted transcriptional regulator